MLLCPPSPRAGLQGYKGLGHDRGPGDEIGGVTVTIWPRTWGAGTDMMHPLLPVEKMTLNSIVLTQSTVNGVVSLKTLEGYYACS